MKEKDSSLLSVLTPSLRLFLSGEFLIKLSEMYSLFMPLYMSELGATVVDIGLFVIIPLGYWVDKRGENIGLGLAYFLLAIHIGVPLIARNFAMLIPAAVIYPFMMGLAVPAYNSLISKAVPEEQRGIAIGLTWTSRGLISIPAPYLGGLLWERVSPRAPFIFAVIGCLGLSVLAFLKLKPPREDERLASHRGCRTFSR